ncbi:MAG TPA: ATP-binding protein [Candidatus Saccharimonadales bacterium]|nr:ATP-binding protein [Candidatus Saccharimonadales bacterium]
MQDLGRQLERAKLLAAVARDAAASSDLDDCLRAVMERLHEAIRFKGGSLAFPDADGLLAIRVAVGVIDDAALAVRLRPGEGIVGTVFSTGRSFRTGDLDAESRVAPAARSVGTNRLMRSFLCVPLTPQGTIVGILEIDSASVDAFSPEDQELLETVATVLAGVVSLARIAEGERTARLARDDFFAAVTHDLRNPLTVIRGQSQRLLRRHGEDADTGPLSAILVQTDRLNRMVTSLLDVARFQSGSDVTLQPREIRVDETVSVIARAVLGPEHEGRLQLDLAPITATVDPVRLEQVVANLVENAAKYSPGGTPIEVRLVEDGPEVVLVISDHGPGIPPDDRSRVFDRYTRVGPVRDGVHGLGLGLFVVRIAVGAHGGTVVVGDRPDGSSGAAISVRLPSRPATGAVPQRDGAEEQV